MSGRSNKIDDLKTLPSVKKWWQNSIGRDAKRVSEEVFLRVLSSDVNNFELPEDLQQTSPVIREHFFQQLIDLCIKKTRSETRVTLQDWNVFVTRYGPLSKCITLTRANLFDEEFHLHPWFHGNEPFRSDCKDPGMWFVRLSSSQVSPMFVFVDSTFRQRQYVRISN